MDKTIFASVGLEEKAKRYNINFDVTPLKKTIFVLIPDIAIGPPMPIYLPYDADLQGAYITSIRCGQVGTLFPGIYEGLPAPYNGHTALNIMSLVDFPRFTFTLADKEGKRGINNVPIRELIQTSAINKWERVYGIWRMQPESSFLTYVDTTRAFNKVVLPMIFEYHPCNQNF